MLAEILKRLGEPWRQSHEDDFGLENAERVADFLNNGGLEFHNNGANYALQYAALCDGYVEIGAWAWFDWQDFDRDADFYVYCEDQFSSEELKRIYDKIKEIYGKN